MGCRLALARARRVAAPAALKLAATSAGSGFSPMCREQAILHGPAMCDVQARAHALILDGTIVRGHAQAVNGESGVYSARSAKAGMRDSS